MSTWCASIVQSSNSQETRLSNCRLKYNSLVSIFSPYRARESHKKEVWVYKLIRRCVPGQHNKQDSFKKLNEISYVIFLRGRCEGYMFLAPNSVETKRFKRQINTKSATVFWVFVSHKIRWIYFSVKMKSSQEASSGSIRGWTFNYII